MKPLGPICCAIFLSVLLVGCGGTSDGCSKVELVTEYSTNPMLIPAVARLINSSDESRLVTIAITRPDGSEIASKTLSVPAKGVTEEGIDRLRTEHEVKIKNCI